MDREAIEDLFAPVARVSVRRMFGGQGIFVDGMMVALEADGILYLKSDADSSAAYDAAGADPFSYGTGRKRVVTSYRRMPEDAFEDPDTLRHWYAVAHGAAVRKAKAKTARARNFTRGKGPAIGQD